MSAPALTAARLRAPSHVSRLPFAVFGCHGFVRYGNPAKCLVYVLVQFHIFKPGFNMGKTGAVAINSDGCCLDVGAHAGHGLRQTVDMGVLTLDLLAKILKVAPVAVNHFSQRGCLLRTAGYFGSNGLRLGKNEILSFFNRGSDYAV